jgi:hypothetical protein
VFTPFSAGHCLTSELNPESESQLLYDWRITANQFVLATSHLRLKPSNFFQLNTCGYSPYATSSLTGGWIYHNCFWASPAQSFSGPSPVELMTIFYCLRFKTPPTRRARSPYLYSPGTLGTDQQKTQPYYCYLHVCWDSHVIATQPVHWFVGCCLARLFRRLFPPTIR